MSGEKTFFTLAKNEYQKIVYAADVERDSGYYCLECGSELVLHRGEKGLRRPHFVHKNTSNCKPETVLHAGFKILIAERIKGDIDNGKEINIQWSCDSCGEDHIADLSQKVSQVFVEKSLTSEFRPDIILTNKEGNPFAVIEVVVAHAPEKQYIKFLKKKGIILIRFDLKSESNIKKAKQKILQPTSMEHCLNPKCEKCGEYKIQSKMLVITSECWNCRSPLNVAVIESGRTGCISPPEFYENEMKIAKENGVIIQNRFSKMAQETYFANVCLHCNQIIGEHYLFTEHYCAAKYGDYPYTEVELGYRCNCEAERKKEEMYEKSEEEMRQVKENEKRLKEITSQFENNLM